MKVARISRDGSTAEAILQGDSALVIGGWRSDDTPAQFELAALGTTELAALAQKPSEVVVLDRVRLLPPAGPLSKIICLGVNYAAHASEIRSDHPENPALFIKFGDALVGHASPIIRPRVSEQFDYEGEIAVVIGKQGRHISRGDALKHVFGYTIMLDGSVRDYQKHSASAGKNFWRSGALGPWIVTADEIPDPATLKLETRLNGVTVQSTTAGLMLYDIPTTIAYISRWTPLAPGDVIATGTPGGVGSRRTPPLWMRHDDLVEIEVSSVGVLGNLVADER
jgi:2-keto-4-pentenoate hydratase/2-oxohepta-3-ene-1,7-dioic acid hydratase in catechol pathway